MSTQQDICFTIQDQKQQRFTAEFVQENMSTQQDILLLQRYFDYPVKAALNGNPTVQLGAAVKLVKQMGQSKQKSPETRVQTNNVVVDVRDEQIKESRIEGAQEVSFKSFYKDPSKQFDDKDAHYVLCCDTGMRSKVACMAMRNRGFNNVDYVVLRGLAAQNTTNSVPSSSYNQIRNVSHIAKGSLYPAAAEVVMKWML
eukprot:TRINITY_DN2425_c1_g1_i1.p1 TRINITY_DN2425_c1_g1~~TRINITY_DN2425_c1_g1_i1.p1  ORF type:complete len:199 (-),score=18.31 TRINITY_DN2425_c1_g1_i1:385-981(-)